MTAIWLICWLLSGTPAVDFDPLNAWATGLAVCPGIDLFGGSR